MNSDTKQENAEKDVEELEAGASSTSLTTPDHLKPSSAKSFRPAACHPDRPIYGSGPLCRKCSDLVRWQGERGKSKVLAYVADNPSLNAAMRADVEDKIGTLKAYERKPEKERKYVDTRKPSVAKHAATTVIVNALDYDKAAVELKPDKTSPSSKRRRSAKPRFLTWQTNSRVSNSTSSFMAKLKQVKSPNLDEEISITLTNEETISIRGLVWARITRLQEEIEHGIPTKEA
jgi:hypothetical protein